MPANTPTTAKSLLTKLHETCTDCGACVAQCRWLADHGSPRWISSRYIQAEQEGNMQVCRSIRNDVFSCNVCGLCTEICPEKATPSATFMALRQEAVNREEVDWKPYSTMLRYEATGRSPLFSWFGLPADRQQRVSGSPAARPDTVFFPGCTLSGTRAETVYKLYQHLSKSIPALGIMLNCCSKPSFDLGRQDVFTEQFEAVRSALRQNGISQVLVACPNCYKVFTESAPELTTRTVYEYLAESTLPSTITVKGEFAIHDPCPMRYATATQDALRTLAVSIGMTPTEMRHRRERTLCCGEGGAVPFKNMRYVESWGALRKKESRGTPLLTACAGCSITLGRHVPTFHILDALFRPATIKTGKAMHTKPPFTYFARLRLKMRFKRLKNLISIS